MSNTSGTSAKRPIQTACSWRTKATMLAMTATVKAIDSQRWTCRTHLLQFNGTSFEYELVRKPADSVCPRQDLLQLREELLPPRFGAPEGLLLIRPETHLLHAQVGPRGRRRERK